MKHPIASIVDYLALAGGLISLVVYDPPVSEWTTYGVIVYFVGIRPLLTKGETNGATPPYSEQSDK